MSNNNYNKKTNMNKLQNMKIENVELKLNTFNNIKFLSITVDDTKTIQLPESKNLFKISDYNDNKKFKLSYKLDEETEEKLNKLQKLIQEKIKTQFPKMKVNIQSFIKEYNDTKYLSLNIKDYTTFYKYNDNKPVKVNQDDFSYHDYKCLVYLDCVVVNKSVFMRFNIKQLLMTKDNTIKKTETDDENNGLLII